jgi:hypothetical protein
MAVYVNNITVDTGTNFYREFYLDNIDGTPLDLTGYTGKSEVRKHPESVGAATTFSVSFVDRTNGLIRLSLNRSETVKLKPGRYVYDVMFTDSSNQKSIVIEGMFNARLDVTPFEAVFADFSASETADPSLGGVVIQFAGVQTDSQSVRSGAGFKRFSETFTGGTLGNSDEYGVICLGVFSTCQGDLSGLETLLDATNSQGITNIQFLNNYLISGGVIWFRGEYGNCVGNTVSNNILAKLGTSIRIDNVTLPSSSAGWMGPLQSGRDNAKLVYTSGKFESVQESTGLPIPLGTSWASLSVNSGTPVYKTSDESRTAFAYERKGNGIIFVGGETLSGGSGFAVGNNDDEGDYWYAPTKELYAALRDLVING